MNIKKIPKNIYAKVRQASAFRQIKKTEKLLGSERNNSMIELPSIGKTEGMTDYFNYNLSQDDVIEIKIGGKPKTKHDFQSEQGLVKIVNDKSQTQ